MALPLATNIYASAQAIYSATPGIGVWRIALHLIGVNTAASTITFVVTVGGRVQFGGPVGYLKAAGYTSIEYPLEVNCIAAEAVVITVQSSNASDTAVTSNTPVSSLQQTNTTQIGGTPQTPRDVGLSVLLSSGTGTGQVSLSNGVVQADVVRVGGSTLAAQALAAKNYAYKDDAVALVADAATDVLRGTALLAAIATARALAPGGIAKAANNRAAILAPPGRYDLVLGTTQTPVGGSSGNNHGALLDVEFVDLIGLTGNPADVIITSQIATASRGTVEQTADDVRISGVLLDLDTAINAASGGDTKNAAYFPSSSLSHATMTDCVVQTSGTGGVAMREGVVYAGTYTRCVGGDCSFGGAGTASGTFSACIAGAKSFGEGLASGVFTDCIGGSESFGGSGSATGRFERCKAGGVSFGEGLASGVFTDCIGGDACFGAAGLASGVFHHCVASGASFGVGGGASGVFFCCVGGDRSFGGVWGTQGGVFIECAGGAYSFAFDNMSFGDQGLYVRCSRDGVPLDTQITAIPTNTQLEARTKPAAEYADKATLNAVAEASQTLVADFTDGTGRLDAALDQIAADVAGLNGDAMRGTDNAAKAGDAMATTANERSAIAAAVVAAQSGPGGVSTTVACTAAGLPVAGVDVWISTDAEGNNVVAGPKVSDAFGNVIFRLDPGTYYVWFQKVGFNETSPQVLTVV